MLKIYGSASSGERESYMGAQPPFSGFVNLEPQEAP